MKRRKTLQELTIKDNFMFGAVMQDALPKRARYYHSQIDMELLMSGAAYSELPNSYVIFICDFDPFERGKYRYVFRNQCEEIPGLSAEDGNITIFLSTHGTNAEEVPKELVKFLEYVSADLEESAENFEDDFVKSLQEAVSSVKRSREMGDRFMLLELMLQDERREGRVEGKVEEIISFLEDLSAVPGELREKIESEKDLSVLKRWLKLAAKADSIEQFISEM